MAKMAIFGCFRLFLFLIEYEGSGPETCTKPVRILGNFWASGWFHLEMEKQKMAKIASFQAKLMKLGRDVPWALGTILKPSWPSRRPLTTIELKRAIFGQNFPYFHIKSDFKDSKMASYTSK